MPKKKLLLIDSDFDLEINLIQMSHRFAEEYERKDKGAFQDKLNGTPFGDKMRQKLNWSFKPKIKESLNLTVAQKVSDES